MRRQVPQRSSRAALVAVAAACVAATGGAHAADMPAPLPAPARLEAQVFAPRPRMNVAVGAGVSLDAAGFSPARTATVPAMFASGGVGAEWPVGVELSAFASSAVGRFRSPDAPIDRLALAAVGVLRPFAWRISPGDTRYRARLVRATGLEAGLGLERVGTTVQAGSRFGLQLGARLEIPLGPANQLTELRLRLAVRRMQGFYTPRVGPIDVGDSVELYAALVTIF